jgi:O-antigen ligase
LQNIVDTRRPLSSRPILLAGGSVILLLITTAYLVTAQDVPSLTVLVAVPACVIFIIVFDRSPAVGVLSLVVSIPFGGVELPLLERTPKLFFTSLLSVILIVTVVPKVILGLRSLEVDRLTRVRGILLKLAIVYCGLVVISVFQAIDSQRSGYIATGRILTFAVFLVALYFTQTAKHRVRVLQSVAIVGGLIAIIYFLGNLQVYDTSTFQRFASDIAKKDNLASAGLLGVSNTIASFMSLTIPLTIALIYLKGRSVQERVLVIVSLVLQLCTLVITNSRGGVVALIAGSFLAALFVPGTLSQASSFFKWVGGLTLFSLIGYAVFVLTPEPIIGRYQSVLSSDSLAVGIPKRLELLSSSWDAFRNSPFFGYGIGNIGFYDLRYGTGAGSETHNLFLQTVAEEGIFSLILLVSILSIIGFRLVMLVRKNSGRAQMWVLAGFMTCLLDAMVEPTFWAPQFVNLFWVSMAILMSGSLAVQAGEVSALENRKAAQG